MGTDEIIHEIQQLPVNSQIFIVEMTLKSINEKEEHDKIELAVNTLLDDYVTDKKLTEFTEIDLEDFYEAR